MLRLALTFRWLGGLALVVVLASVFVLLSAWQVNRAQHKNDATVSPEANVLTPINEVLTAQTPMPARDSDRLVAASGEFLPNSTVLVQGRINGDARGYWVVTMFAVDNAPVAPDATGSLPAAIPVVRGFTTDENTALGSQAPTGQVSITGRIGPTEGPEPDEVASGTGAGAAGSGVDGGAGIHIVRSVSTAQLVNFFDVYSYGAILFPEPNNHAAVAGPELQHVEFSAQESGGFDIQSGFYAIEWLVFAGFAFYIWWRLLKDAYLKTLTSASREGEGAPRYVVVKKPGDDLGDKK